MDPPSIKSRYAPVNFKSGAFSLLIAMIICFLIYFAVKQNDRPTNLPYSPESDIAKCEIVISRSLGAAVKNILDYDHISNHCIEEISNIYKLQDYTTRRDAFDIQYGQSNFILCLVICITISGIVLAAVQLTAAYNLSLYFDKYISDSTSLNIDTKGISIRSTFSGLVILAMSFAFFLVYVMQVYPIEVTDKVSLSPSNLVPQSTTAPATASAPSHLAPGFATNMGYMPVNMGLPRLGAITGTAVAVSNIAGTGPKSSVANARVGTNHMVNGRSNMGMMAVDLQKSRLSETATTCPGQASSSLVK